jgi:hypothetical protein
VFARPDAAVSRRQRYHYDAETDRTHDQHVEQIKQCIFHLQPAVLTPASQGLSERWEGQRVNESTAVPILTRHGIAFG